MNTSLQDMVELSDWARHRLSDRLAGMTDAEYLWQPGPDCWSVRPAGEGEYRAEGPAGRGEADHFTTLGWRVALA